MNKASGSIHLDSLSSSYGRMEPLPTRQHRLSDDLCPYDKVTDMAFKDLYKYPSELWGQRTLSDEEYKRQADAMKRFCCGDDQDSKLILKRTR